MISAGEIFGAKAPMALPAFAMSPLLANAQAPAALVPAFQSAFTMAAPTAIPAAASAGSPTRVVPVLLAGAHPEHTVPSKIDRGVPPELRAKLSECESRNRETRIPPAVLERARRVMRVRHGIANSPDRHFKVIVKEGNAFLLRHLKGQMLAVVHEPESDSADYYYEHFFKECGAYFKEGRLLRTETILDSFDRLCLVEIEGAGKRIFERVDGEGEWKLVYERYVPEFKMDVVEGRVYLRVTADERALERGEVSAADGLFSEEFPTILYPTVPSDPDDPLPMVNRFFPALGIATDRNGVASHAEVYRLGDTKFAIGFLPNRSTYGEFEYDGTGDFRNIKVFEVREDGTYVPQTQRDILEILHPDEVIDMDSFPMPEKISRGRIRRSDIATPKDKVRAYSQVVRLASKGETKEVEVAIEAENLAEYAYSIEQLLEYLRSFPLALMNDTRRIEIFKKEQNAYGFFSVDIGGVCDRSKKLVRVFRFDEDGIAKRLTLAHELMHTKHRDDLGLVWRIAVLAIIAGSAVEYGIMHGLTNSDYFSKSWKECVADAGAMLTDPVLGEGLISGAPFIASAALYCMLQDPAKDEESGVISEPKS